MDPRHQQQQQQQQQQHQQQQPFYGLQQQVVAGQYPAGYSASPQSASLYYGYPAPSGHPSQVPGQAAQYFMYSQSSASSGGYYPNNHITAPVVELKAWIPSPNDQEILDRWFNDLDIAHKGVISGQDSVAFLTRSNLPRETLKQLWSQVDPSATGYLYRSQFYSLLRFFAIAVHPMFSGSIPTNEVFNANLDQQFSLPPMLLDSSTSSDAQSMPAIKIQSTASTDVIPNERSRMSTNEGNRVPEVDRGVDEDDFTDFASASVEDVPVMFNRTPSPDLLTLVDFGPASFAVTNPPRERQLASIIDIMGPVLFNNEDEFDDFQDASTIDNSLTVAIESPVSTQLEPDIVLSAPSNSLDVSATFSPNVKNNTSADFSVFDELVVETQNATEDADDWDDFVVAPSIEDTDLIVLDESFTVSARSESITEAKVEAGLAIDNFPEIVSSSLPPKMFHLSSPANDILSLFGENVISQEKTEVALNMFSIHEKGSFQDSKMNSLLNLSLPPMTEKEKEDLEYFHSVQQSSASVSNDNGGDDNFGDFESFPTSPLPIIKSAVILIDYDDGFEDFQGVTASSTADPSRSNVLSTDELLGFAEALADTFHYEEALLCLRQYYLLKNGPAACTSDCPQEKINHWRSLVASGQIGVSIEEMTDLLSMMNIKASKIFEKEASIGDESLCQTMSLRLEKYLKNGPKQKAFVEAFNGACPSDTLLFQCLSRVGLKRRIKCSVALFTSHKELLSAWGPLLHYCLTKLLEFEDVLKRFSKMIDADQKSVLESEKFMCYLASVIVIMELIVLVAYSIFQYSLVFPILEPLLVEANKVVRSLDTIKKYAQSTVSLSILLPQSFFDKLSFEFLEIQAVEDTLLYAFDKNSPEFEVFFCDLTLQPIRLKHEEAVIDQHEPCAWPLKAHAMNRLEVISKRKYFKPMVQIWKKKINDELPKVDEPFVYD